MGRLENVLRGEVDVTEQQLTKVLGATFAVSLLVVVVLAMTPMGSGAAYTEFYVLGPEGSASGYPSNLTVGESAEVLVGVGNQEGEGHTYTLVARTTDTTLETRTLQIQSSESWEEPLTVSFDSPGEKELRLELYLGTDTSGEPYRSLRLLIDVTE